MMDLTDGGGGPGVLAAAKSMGSSTATVARFEQHGPSPTYAALPG